MGYLKCRPVMRALRKGKPHLEACSDRMPCCTQPGTLYLESVGFRWIWASFWLWPSIPHCGRYRFIQHTHQIYPNVCLTASGEKETKRQRCKPVLLCLLWLFWPHKSHIGIGGGCFFGGGVCFVTL